MKPTQQTYGELVRAYEYFNNMLFEGLLPECMITLQRKRNNLGFFHPERFTNKQLHSHEIGLNPEYFLTHSIEEVLATVVHNMVHLWQHQAGRPSRNGYHNREWAEKMTEIGLMPSSTGLPGGKKTGPKGWHYIMAEGQFIKACRILLESDFSITWYDRHAAKPMHPNQEEAEKAGTALMPVEVSPAPIEDLEESELIRDDAAAKKLKGKYSCSGCEINVWGKQGLNLRCDDCDLQLVAIMPGKDETISA